MLLEKVMQNENKMAAQVVDGMVPGVA